MGISFVGALFYITYYVVSTLLIFFTGERLIQYASENLVTEILIHPQYNTLIQCMRNLLSSFTRHRHIIHAGYTFSGNGSWILQVCDEFHKTIIFFVICMYKVHVNLIQYTNRRMEHFLCRTFPKPFKSMKCSVSFAPIQTLFPWIFTAIPLRVSGPRCQSSHLPRAAKFALTRLMF